MSNRQVLIQYHTDTQGKLPEDSNLGEIYVNHNVEKPFLTIKTVDGNNNVSYPTTVMQAELSADIDNPVVENGVLTIPWKYNELLEKYNSLLERLITVENELGISTSQVYLETAEALSSGWKFNLVSSASDTGYSYETADEISVTYDDSSWSDVSVPHDWSIYRDFNSGCTGSSDAAWLDGGDAWYRKTLSITSDMKDKRIILYFDGIYMESAVFVNGTKLHENHFGYNPFYVDCTDVIDFDGTNVVSVFVRNNQPNTRFYAGSGIIRECAMLTGMKADVALGDIIVTTPNISTEYSDSASTVTTNVKTTLTSDIKSDVTLLCEIIDASGSKIASANKYVSVDSGSSTEVLFEVPVTGVKLWAIGEGNLYKARVKVVNGKTSYYKTASFGYRWFTFDVTNGFSLNGVNMKLKGVCIHEDHGCLGMEASEIAYDRELEKLQKMGINAVRTAHNPFPKEFLPLCEKRGILVLEDLFDEWNTQQAGIIYETNGFYRYFDSEYESVLRNVLARDVNSPSIFAWLIGNEIFISSTDGAVASAKQIISVIREYDSYRPVTMGDNVPSTEVSLALADLLDIEGVNYGSESEYTTFRTNKPTLPLFGSETTSAVSSRDNYTNDSTNKQCSSFDEQLVGWAEGGSAAEILKRHMADISYMMGMFVWTGFDYMGEPTPYAATYPAKSSYFGIVDMAGFPKDIYYMYQSQWSSEPMIHIVGDWEYKEGDTSNRTIWLYSNCNSVELYLNGVLQDSAKTQADMGDKYNYVYSLAYTPGTLVANGYDSGGTLVAQDIKYTSLGTVKKIECYCDNSSIKKDDLAFIECSLVDSNGVRVPTANNSVEFTAGSNCTIVATDAGNAVSVENMRASKKNAFNGNILVVAKPKAAGEVTVSTNFTTEVKESVVCGNSRVFRTRTNTFIDATNPTIYVYTFDGTEFVSIGTDVASTQYAEPVTSATWTVNVTATGKDSYVGANLKATHNGPVAVDCSTGIYEFVATPVSGDTLSNIYLVILEIDSDGNVINTQQVNFNEKFALLTNTKEIMINVDGTAISTTMFDNFTTFGIKKYEEYEFVSPTALSFKSTGLTLDSRSIGSKLDILSYMDYEPDDSVLNLQRNLTVTSSSDSVISTLGHYLNILATGSTTLTATIGDKSVTMNVEVEQYEGEWDIEWDGSTNTISDNMVLSNAAIVANSDTTSGGTYSITASTQSGGISLYPDNTITHGSKLEILFRTKESTNYNGWGFGIRLRKGTGYCASAMIKSPLFTGTALQSYGSTTIQQLSGGTVYKLVMDLTSTTANEYTVSIDDGTAVTCTTANEGEVQSKTMEMWIGDVAEILALKFKKA